MTLIGKMLLFRPLSLTLSPDPYRPSGTFPKMERKRIFLFNERGHSNSFMRFVYYLQLAKSLYFGEGSEASE